MEIPLSQDSINVLVEGSGFWGWPARAGRLELAG